MSEWKCEICNSSFENFDARGFNNKIYCPLCYYKKLYTDTELEREKLNNIIKEVRKLVENGTDFKSIYFKKEKDDLWKVILAKEIKEKYLAILDKGSAD